MTHLLSLPFPVKAELVKSVSLRNQSKKALRMDLEI
jgi:hypothetical protein